MATKIHEAKTHFSKLLSKAGTPVAVLAGIDRYKPKRELGFATGAFTMSPLEEFNAPLDPETMAFFHGDPEA